MIEARERLRCVACRFVLYENPACAAAGLVIDAAGRVLLVRRALEPCRGTWALPAGYQEIDEPLPRTVEREVREECGLEVATGELFELLFAPENARKPTNLAVYLCRVVGGQLAPGDDALEAGWFALDALPQPIGFDNGPRVLSRLATDRRYLALVSSLQSEQGRAERPISYRDAGVDIEQKYSAVERASPSIRATFTPGVVGDVGAFGGLFDLARAGVGRGLRVASAAGVGTKLEIARRARVYDTVGRDLVHHCINDILVQGAQPLFFLDYVAVGKMEPLMASELIRGCADACRANGFALLGGETAEMPGLYAPGDFDLAGFIVGIVDPAKLLDGSRVRPGHLLIGLESAGLHTNGYSLARKIVFDALGLGLDDRPEGLGGATVGEALLAEHRSYYRLLWPLLEQGRIAAMAHITGGGLVDNLPRVLNGCDALIDRGAWNVPPLMRFLCTAGRVDRDESYQAFNMGIGMVLLVAPGDFDAVTGHLRANGERALAIGRVESGDGRVRWSDA